MSSPDSGNVSSVASTQQDDPVAPIGCPVRGSLIEAVKNCPLVWTDEQGKLQNEEWEKIATEIFKKSGFLLPAITARLLWSDLKSIHQKSIEIQQPHFYQDQMTSLLDYIEKNKETVGSNSQNALNDNSSSDNGDNSTEMNSILRVLSSSLISSPTFSCLPPLVSSEVFRSPTPSIYSTSFPHPEESALSETFQHSCVIQEKDLTAAEKDAKNQFAVPNKFNRTYPISWYMSPRNSCRNFELSDHLSTFSKHIADSKKILIETQLGSSNNSRKTPVSEGNTEGFDEVVYKSLPILKSINDTHLCQKTFLSARSPTKTPISNTVSSEEESPQKTTSKNN